MEHLESATARAGIVSFTGFLWFEYSGQVQEEQAIRWIGVQLQTFLLLTSFKDGCPSFNYNNHGLLGANFIRQPLRVGLCQ